MPVGHAPRGLAMLVTTCRHCGARFRVTPDQLNLRQGQVRCGQCHDVFNGFEALERFPGDDTGAKLLAMRAGQKPQPAPTQPAPAGPASAQPPAAPAPQAAPRVELADITDLPDVPDLSGIPDLVLEGNLPATAGAEPVRAEPAPRVPVALPPPPATAAPAVPLVLREPEPPARVSRAWSFGVALLALLLALQVAYAFRATLAQQYPVLRPPFEAVCAAVGCRVPWVNDEAALKLEDSELLEVPGKPGQIALQARIRNLSATAQEYPHLELTLTDITGQTAVRRVLRPMDYLGRAPAAGEVMAGGSEALISVRLETGRIRPTGYELLLFYP